MRRSWIESGAASSPSKASAPSLIGLEPGDEPQQRGLARAGRSEQRQKLARRDVEIDAIENALGAEALRDAADLDAARREGAVPASARSALQPALFAERGADAPFENGS